MDLSGKVIIVTGGAVRVGRAICKELALTGAAIVCHYHSSETQARSLAAELTGRDQSVLLFKGDLSRPETIEKLVNAAWQRFGRIDGLVNNASLFYKTPLGQISDRDWEIFMSLNLKSPFFLAQQVVPKMRAVGGGKIVNIGDSGALSPFPSYLPYSISKAGLINMTIGLAKALAPDIQVNCINPGPVMLPEDMDEQEKQFAVNQTLLKRPGSAEDIARTVRFLLEGSDYITGAIIPVDGGRSAR